MADFVEQSIYTYSGLSTETKPTIAVGNNVPNGSRFREVDTGKAYFFNKSDDAWYHIEGPHSRMKTYSYANGNIKYVCNNEDIDANETDTDWLCWKFTDADIPDKEGPRAGAVNTEAAVNTLSWNI